MVVKGVVHGDLMFGDGRLIHFVEVSHRGYVGRGGILVLVKLVLTARYL